MDRFSTRQISGNLLVRERQGGPVIYVEERPGDWYRNMWPCNDPDRDAGTDCDEFPYKRANEGYPTLVPFPSLRVLSTKQNGDEGRPWDGSIRGAA